MGAGVVGRHITFNLHPGPANQIEPSFDGSRGATRRPIERQRVLAGGELSGVGRDRPSAALIRNAGVLRRAIAAEARLGLMVRANGYGHGLEMAARAAVAAGADLLMVATLDELTTTIG